MNCCIIDDEPLAAELIRSYVEKTPFLTYGATFHSAQDAVKEVMSGEFDLVFLDIKMPQLNGMEFARLVPESTRIIFITAYDDHALEAFRVGAADYLLKPVSFEEFTAAVSRLHRLKGEPAVQNRDKQHLLVKNNHKFEQINVADIIFVEGLKDYVKIHLANQRRVVTLTSMKNLEELLPETHFMRVHRSFIINTSRIAAIERSRIMMEGGMAIPVSDGYKQAVSDYIASHS